MITYQQYLYNLIQLENVLEINTIQQKGLRIFTSVVKNISTFKLSNCQRVKYQAGTKQISATSGGLLGTIALDWGKHVSLLCRLKTF